MPDVFTALTGSGAGDEYQIGDRWGYQTAEKCRENFNVLKTASDLNTGTNTGDVTLAGTPNYLTIAAQVITRALINLASHVTGRLPYANLTASTAASRLLGRTSGSAGDWQEISLGTTLALTATVLDTTSGVLKATVPLTNAQIKALPTTPFILVASPGVNKRIVLLHADVVASFTAAAYTNINAAAYSTITQGGNLASSYLANDAGTTPALTHFSDVFGAASEQLVTFSPWQDTSEAAAQWGLLASVANVTSAQNMVLEINNSGSGDLTGGNAANTMTVNVLYLIR